MKNGILLLLLLSAVAMGYLLGRHIGVQTVGRPSRISKPVRSSARSNTTLSGAETPGIHYYRRFNRELSLAEIEEKIRGLKISDYRWGTGAPRAWLELFDQISAEDMLEVMSFIAKNCPANMQRLLERGLCGHWADIDPQGALNFANHLSNKVDRQIAINLIISDWSANDPAAAMAWAKQLPAGSFRNEILQNVIAGMAAADPKGALERMHRVQRREYWHLRFPIPTAWLHLQRVDRERSGGSGAGSGTIIRSSRSPNCASNRRVLLGSH